MRRMLPILLALFSISLFVGCPGGSKKDGDGGGDGTAVSDGTPTDGARSTGGEFKEGVDSGRAEDGSDEEK